MWPCCKVAIHSELRRFKKGYLLAQILFFASQFVSYFFSAVHIMRAKGYIFLLFLCHTPTIANRTCYWPDGSSIPDSFDYTPCNLTATSEDSACCNSNDPCSPNGYCFGTAGYIYRGGCTDVNWDADECCPSCRNCI